MSENAAALVFYLLLVVAAAGAIIAVTAAVGRREGPPARDLVYECGLDQATMPRRRISVHFFLIAALFLLFDVEVALLFPWAVAFREAAVQAGGLLLLELALFLGLVGVALAFAWGNGALEWESDSVTRNR